MASKTTLTAANLEALGAEKLASLLLEISTGNANAKRRLRMELAGKESPDKLTGEIRKRLTAIGAATTNIGWRTLKAFKAELDSQRRLIVEQVAGPSPAEALDLLWQMIAMGNILLERTTDSSGEVLAILREASGDAGRLIDTVKPAADDLIPRLVDATIGNGYGQNDTLVFAAAPALGTDGLKALRDALLLAGKVPEDRPAVKARKMSRWRRSRSEHREGARRTTRAELVRQALEQIADAGGDVDAFIALQPEAHNPAIATRIAERLLRTGRAEEALGYLDRVRGGASVPHSQAWEEARIAALEATGRRADAQAFRLELFHRSLNPVALRAYLKRLPDFDDVEAEDAALDGVEETKDVHTALAFLVHWPALDRAARVTLRRYREIDGQHEDLLVLAADKLAARYPLPAMLLLRRVVDIIVVKGRSTAYDQASEYVSDMARLSARVEHFEGFDDHAAFMHALHIAYPARTAFWTAVG